MTLYSTVQEIVNMLRDGSRDFKSMIGMLEKAGMSTEEAQKMLDRLIHQVDEE